MAPESLSQPSTKMGRAPTISMFFQFLSQGKEEDTLACSCLDLTGTLSTQLAHVKRMESLSGPFRCHGFLLLLASTYQLDSETQVGHSVYTE